MTADEIIAAARAEIDTPFVHQGRLPGRALDCAGLCVIVARHWHDVAEPAAYSRSPSGGQLESWLERQNFLERAATPQTGDILLMRFTGEPQHLAIFTGVNIIHSYQASGRVVEHILDAKWRRRIVRVYRFKDMA